jgi:hypothetical protein
MAHFTSRSWHFVTVAMALRPDLTSVETFAIDPNRHAAKAYADELFCARIWHDACTQWSVRPEALTKVNLIGAGTEEARRKPGSMI